MATYMEERTRELSPEEFLSTVKAMQWLYKKGISPERIQRMTRREIDLEKKTAEFRYHPKLFPHTIVVRNLPYANSPLEKHIELAYSQLKSNHRVFPKRAWKGKIASSLMPPFSVEQVEKFVGKNLKTNSKTKSLWNKEAKRVIININR